MGVPLFGSPDFSADGLSLDNGGLGLDGTLRDVVDGAGTASLLQLSTAQLNINDTPGNHAAAPSLALNADSGWYLAFTNEMYLALGGSAKWTFSGGAISSILTGGAQLVLAPSTSTLPGHAFLGDTDTGTGLAGPDQLSGIAGGVEGWRLVEDTTITMHFPETTTPSAIANYGSLYFKSDNKLYAQTGDGAEHEVAFA